MDLALDDIIKKNPKYKNVRGAANKQSSNRNQRRFRRVPTSRSNTAPPQRDSRNMRRSTNQVKDARLHIINKSRFKMTDARDKLAQLAKKTDARYKLDKLRINRNNATSNTNYGPMRRTIRNGFVNQARARTDVPQRKNNIPLRRTVQTGYRSQIPSLLDIDVSDVAMNSEYANPSIIRRTVNNNIVSSNQGEYIRKIYNKDDEGMMPYYSRLRSDEMSSMTARSSILRDSTSASRPSNLQIIALNSQQMPGGNYLDHERWEYSSRMRERRSPVPLIGLESDDEADICPRISQDYRSKGIQDVKSRLDTPIPSRNIGMLSNSVQAISIQQQGYRIVVSNLQPSVTHEDIRELFEDIGPLLASRLVRPGTAEVVYQAQKDAVKAVDAYHNRQLDGQPMKCMLVNSRSSSTPLKSGHGASGNLKIPSSGKSAVIPDLSTIHKALFNKS